MSKLISTYLMPHPPVLIPEIGNGKEEICQSTLDALDKVSKQIAEEAPETIVVISPHGTVFSDGIGVLYNEKLKGDLALFGNHTLRIQKNNYIKFVEELVYVAGKIDVTCAKIDDDFADDMGISASIDHGAQVPLYFVDKYYKDYKLVHISYGLLSIPKLYEFGQALKEVINQMTGNTVIIASGDLSHKLMDSGPYSFDKSGPLFDNAFVEKLTEADVVGALTLDKAMVRDAGECGFRSVNIMLGALDGYSFDVEPLSYEGPFGVGYAVMRFSNLVQDQSALRLNTIKEQEWQHIHRVRASEDDYVKLAREAVEAIVVKGEEIKPVGDKTSEMFTKRAGVFVSIKSHGGLRGCIGTIGATTENIACEIVANAVKAAVGDPRFAPIEADELGDLLISVDILGMPEPIVSIDELDVLKYGVIVTQDHKRGLLLPNLDGVTTVDEQIRIACSKAGIGEDEPYQLERFEVIRHK